MKPAELDSVIDSVESIHRIAAALSRDTAALATVLKQVQSRPAAPSERADIFAYDEQLHRTLKHYGLPEGSVRESLHETLLTQYAQLHGIDPSVFGPLLVKLRQPESNHAPTAALAVADGPTPTTPLQDSLLELTDSLARRQAVPKPLGEMVSQYLSPSVLRSGRGFIKPGSHEDHGSYSEDLLQVGAQRAVKWPDGWYKHKNISSSPDQLYFRTENFAILIVELESGIPTGYVSKFAAEPGEWVVVGDLSRGENLAMCAEVEAHFEKLSASAKL